MGLKVLKEDQAASVETHCGRSRLVMVWYLRRWSSGWKYITEVGQQQDMLVKVNVAHYVHTVAKREFARHKS